MKRIDNRSTLCESIVMILATAIILSIAGPCEPIYAQTPTPPPPESVIWEDWPSLISRWAFDAGEGLTVYDSVSGYNGTFTKLTENAWSSQTAKFGSSLHWNYQTGEYINVGGDVHFNLTTELTILFWLRSNSSGSLHRNVLTRWNPQTKAFIIQKRSNSDARLYAKIDDDTTLLELGGAVISTNIWMFVAWVQDSDSCTIWTNNHKETKSSWGHLLGDTVMPLFIGGGPSYYSPDGYLDELNIFNRALTDAEITQIRNNATPSPSPTPALKDVHIHRGGCLVNYW